MHGEQAAMTQFSRAACALPLATFACFALTAPVHADSPDRKAAKFASGSGNILYLAAGLGLPLLSDGANGTRHSLRVADSLVVSLAITEGLKGLTREKRPDSNAHDSFPSGHATAAFAVATMESSLHPRQAPLWYLGATLISASRVRLRRHNTGDVLVGAAIGAGVSRIEIVQPHGLLLSPFLTPDGHGMGFQMTRGL